MHGKKNIKPNMFHTYYTNIHKTGREMHTDISFWSDSIRVQIHET